VNKMDIETLIIGTECVAGFAAGFKHGITHDRNLIAVLEMKESEADKEKYDNAKKHISKDLNITEIKESGIVGFIIGMTNLGCTANPQMFSEGLFAVGVSTYLGLKAGKIYSKFRRDHAKITPEQESAIDEYLSELKACYKNDDDSFDKTSEKLRDYWSEIYTAARSPKLEKQMLEKIKPVLAPLGDYRNLKRLMKNTEDGIGATSFYDKKDKPIDVLFVHDYKLFRFNVETLKDVSNEEGFKNFIDRMEQLPWSGTVDDMFNHMQDLGNYRTVIVVNGPSDAPMEMKLMAAKSYYKMSRIFR